MIEQITSDCTVIFIQASFSIKRMPLYELHMLKIEARLKYGTNLFQ